MPDASLLQLLHEDLQTSQQLLALLDEEFAALQARDLHLLEKLLGSKQPLLAALSQNAQVRSQTLHSLGHSPDATGWNAYLAGHAQAEDLDKASQQLEQQLEQCRQANLRNGRLINANQASVGSLLGILRGAETPSLYDSRGATARIAQQRPLSQA